MRERVLLESANPLDSQYHFIENGGEDREEYTLIALTALNTEIRQLPGGETRIYWIRKAAWVIRSYLY